MKIDAQLKSKVLERASEILDGPMSLDKAILIAVIAHAGQKDKGKNSYIRHPLRVMEAMETEDEMCVAINHDVVEDTNFSLSDLSKLGFTTNQIDAIDALTKKEGEEYIPSIYARVLPNPIARRVKTQDIRDNSSLWRLKSRTLGPKDVERMQNYIDALTILEGGIRK